MEDQNYIKDAGQYNQGAPVPPRQEPVILQTESNVTPPLKPKNWMIESILVTAIPFLCCCNVFALLGIVAIVNASRVDKLFYNREYSASEAASKTAKTWVYITLGIAVLGIIANIILWTTGFSKAFMESYMDTLQSISGGGATEY